MTVMLGMLLGLVEIILIPIQVCLALPWSIFLLQKRLREGGIESDAASAYVHIFYCLLSIM